MNTVEYIIPVGNVVFVAGNACTVVQNICSDQYIVKAKSGILVLFPRKEFYHKDPIQ